VALTLQPKLAPANGDEATAYDHALALTQGDVGSYWRPTEDNYLSRISRDQLLSLGREAMGETWAKARTGEKKASLVAELNRAFSDPAKCSWMPQQVGTLKSWLPAGMAFGLAPTVTRDARRSGNRQGHSSGSCSLTTHLVQPRVALLFLRVCRLNP
jgi:hypothetical protein